MFDCLTKKHSSKEIRKIKQETLGISLRLSELEKEAEKLRPGIFMLAVYSFGTILMIGLGLWMITSPDGFKTINDFGKLTIEPKETAVLLFQAAGACGTGLRPPFNRVIPFIMVFASGLAVFAFA